ncbi:MAG: hypothetical protein AAB596_01715 [Patescibacteria group bacterium]
MNDKKNLQGKDWTIRWEKSNNGSEKHDSGEQHCCQDEAINIADKMLAKGYGITIIKRKEKK